LKKRLAALVAAFSAVALIGGIAMAGTDFGQFVQDRLGSESNRLFGVSGPLDQSSTVSISAAEAQADARRLATLAKSLKARVVTQGVAPPDLDMSALWPDDKQPQWLITCNEEGTAAPGLVRINIQTGAVATIVTGTASCDPARRTPWGTILFAEEAGGGPNGGRVYELIDPLNTTGVTLNRATGTFSGGTGAANLTARPALGRLSFEGHAIYPNGVVYYGDELAPINGAAGGSIYKFVPSQLRDPAAGPISNLGQSPLVAGSIFGLRVGGNTHEGQGSEFAQGRWIPVPAAPDPDLRAQAGPLRLTGYYRPEDIDIDPDAAAASRVRFCGADTGDEGAQNWGEITCVTDGSLQQATAGSAVPEVQLFVPGSPAFAMPDNVAFQPEGGNVIIHEDADTNTALQGPHNNDLWDCLPDGSDANLQSDGCIRIASLNDLTAEWTGGIFDASGEHFYVSVQHNISGKGVILDITGWK
jgi:secreted PhoX family phosphatase